MDSVHLKAHILGKGLIIADLPGLRDLNSARQNVTERYVRSCHQIFAVSRIGRATTDVGVREVFDLSRRAGLSNIGVVCTMADEIKSKEAAADWRSEKPYVDKMNRKIETAKRKCRKIQGDIDELNELDDLDEDEKDELVELHRERDTARKHYKDLDRQLKTHLINFRNSKVTTELRKRYQPDTAGESLKVFCVSNTMYWDNRNNPIRSSLPLLELSGIFDLRRHCIGIVADSHLQATTKYIKDDIPALLSSVELWTQAGSGNGSAEKKEVILKAVEDVQRQLNQVRSTTIR